MNRVFQIAGSYPCTSDACSDGIGMLTEANQEKIVEAGGLGSLLNLLQSSEDETIRRVAAGAVANLAMNGKVLVYTHED